MIFAGLSGESLNAVIHRVNSLEMLMCKNEIELRAILTDNSQVRDEEVRRLIRAMNCLRMCQTCIKTGRKEQNDLFWDSWDRHHHSQLKPGTSPRTERGKLNSKGIIRHHHNHIPFTINNGTPLNNQYESQQTQSPLELSPPEHVPQTTSEDLTFHTLTPSPSPPNSPANNSKTRTKGFPTTPPPKKKHQTLVSASSVLGTPPPHSNNSSGASNATSNVNNAGHVSAYDQQSLSKSRSHEFQLLKQQQLKQQLEQNNQQEQQLSQSQDNSHPLLTSSNSHQPSSTNLSSNGNSTTPDSGVHMMHSSTTTINTSECNTSMSYSIPTPRSRLHTEPGE